MWLEYVFVLMCNELLEVTELAYLYHNFCSIHVGCQDMEHVQFIYVQVVPETLLHGTVAGLESGRYHAGILHVCT